MRRSKMTLADLQDTLVGQETRITYDDLPVLDEDKSAVAVGRQLEVPGAMTPAARHCQQELVACGAVHDKLVLPGRTSEIRDYVYTIYVEIHQINLSMKSPLCYKLCGCKIGFTYGCTTTAEMTTLEDNIVLKNDASYFVII